MTCLVMAIDENPSARRVLADWYRVVRAIVDDAFELLHGVGLNHAFGGKSAPKDCGGKSPRLLPAGAWH
jgi:hypothetical protein